MNPIKKMTIGVAATFATISIATTMIKNDQRNVATASLRAPTFYEIALLNEYRAQSFDNGILLDGEYHSTAYNETQAYLPAVWQFSAPEETFIYKVMENENVHAVSGTFEIVGKTMQFSSLQGDKGIINSTGVALDHLDGNVVIIKTDGTTLPLVSSLLN